MMQDYDILHHFYSLFPKKAIRFRGSIFLSSSLEEVRTKTKYNANFCINLIKKYSWYMFLHDIWLYKQNNRRLFCHSTKILVPLQ